MTSSEWQTVYNMSPIGLDETNIPNLIADLAAVEKENARLKKLLSERADAAEARVKELEQFVGPDGAERFHELLEMEAAQESTFIEGAEFGFEKAEAGPSVLPKDWAAREYRRRHSANKGTPGAEVVETIDGEKSVGQWMEAPRSAEEKA